MMFGEWLREKRRATGLNQPDFAEMLRVGARTIGAWETGINTPPPNMLRLVLSRLHVTVDQYRKETAPKGGDNVAKSLPLWLMCKRKERNLTLEELAKLSGVSSYVLSAWEHGRHTPRDHKLYAVLKAMHIPWGQYQKELEVDR